MNPHSDPMDSKQLLQTRWSMLSRLKNWQDDKSWQEFFDTYWELIYSVAIKAGLTQTEAQDAVQETLLAVARNISAVKRDPARGPFKSWLLNTARWKIMDQFRKRPPTAAAGRSREKAPDDTSTAARMPDPASCDLSAAWEMEWTARVLLAALERGMCLPLLMSSRRVIGGQREAIAQKADERLPQLPACRSQTPEHLRRTSAFFGLITAGDLARYYCRA